ncbi:transcriptional regulator, TetR family [Caloramator quimbayensis]|uniref:Transcriptional regulator, TetR family n=1 Tax=Caloramator quimbayensis TaxID=1147123 RepID=A0A1T4Y1U9_9CLOT|nr:TetR/AcrR family transcriptional regulator [Caloramator quimbayensis]SKA95769.1 transcriptional regulator, TetR family [Caloramator quimbayensis]
MVKEKSDKIHKNKLIKRNKLFDAAYDLFLTKGFSSTAIDDIVKKAGVAKGTFYLYFKDKYDIMDHLILSKSSLVIKEALQKIKDENYNNYIDRVISFIDYIVEYFKNNKMLLKIIHKNLSFGLFRKALQKPEEYKEMKEVADLLLSSLKKEGFSDDNIEKILFMVIELTGSVIYSSIILEEPDTIDNMKPVLFMMVKKMLTI